MSANNIIYKTNFKKAEGQLKQLKKHLEKKGFFH